MDREEGFYWIKSGGEWEVAKWRGDIFGWVGAGWIDGFYGDDVAEIIGPKVDLPTGLDGHEVHEITPEEVARVNASQPNVQWP